MYEPALKKKGSKSSLATLQATFHRHRRKIDQLRGQFEAMKKECEQALALYHSSLKPKEKKAADLITQFLLKIQDLTRDPQSIK